MRLLRFSPLLLLPLFLGLSACEDVATSPDAMDESAGTGMVAFRFSSAQIDSLAKQVDTLEIVLDNGKTKWTRRTGLSTEVDFSDVPAGSWKLVVTLRQGGVAKYEGSTQVTIVSGATTDAKVVLSAVSGGLRIEIGFDDDGSATPLSTELVGTWYLSELPGTGAVLDTIPLTFSDDGTVGGSDGCNYWSGMWSAPADSVIRVTFGMTTLKACLDSSGNLVNKGYTKPLAGDVVWNVERIFGVVGDVRKLTLKNPKTGTVVGRYSNLPSMSVITPFVPPFVPAWQSNPMAVVGVWGLVSLPIEGLDSAGAMLLFDSLGGVSGTIACNAVSGSWKLDGDGELLVTMSNTTDRVCSDPTEVLTERGLHLMASVPLDWSIDGIPGSSNLERITVSSLATGDTIAVFALSRFGVTYYSTPVVPIAPIVLPPIDFIKRRPMDPLPE